MSFDIWCLTGLLLLSALAVSDAFDACGYRQKLEPGKRLGLVSPDYPDSYPTSAYCRWYLSSDTRVRLTCNEFNVIPSPDCQSDFLQVFTNPSLPALIFCGSRSFSLESDGNEMNVTLTTAVNTPGGSFNCYVEAIEMEQCTCGWKNTVQSRIVGGTDAGVNEYPMMAAIIDVDKKFIRCGATIISDKHVLTAAHCLGDRTVNDVEIIVGAHNLTEAIDTDVGASKHYRAARFDVHPNYKSTSHEYDVAVITIDGGISFSNKVGPVCLPFKHDVLDSFAGLNVDVIGWGSTAFGYAPSDILQKVSLSVLSLSDCKKQDPTVNDRHICTYASGKDSCQFDSGGPVLWQNPATGRVVLIGIINIGRSCADTSPATNARVGSYLDWIRQVTPGIQYCQAE